MSGHGATFLDDGTTRFRVWAPGRDRVALLLAGRSVELEPVADGFHEVVTHGAGPGTRYRYLLDGEGPYADPAARSQPEGVHGPSAVVARRRPGEGAWRGLPLAAYVICEVHVGTFSAAGTFAGVADAVDELAAAGYSAIELMPVAEFPGTRNWGYDGVFPFAVQSSYGGPDGLAALVEHAHRRGVAVVADVVYNHLGPEGSVHDAFGPYHSDRYTTPWGPAINVDGPGSDAVRSYFVEHACYLVTELGVDALRLDAVHEILDRSASPFLAELTSAVEAAGRAAGRAVAVIAESAANDPRLTTPVAAGGLGCDASWDDDFHHALRSTLTGERDRWFADFDGVTDLARATGRGFVLAGRRSTAFGRRHGAPMPERFDGARLVVYAQNHDQVANAGNGVRLASLLGTEAQYPIATTVLLAPYLPLRFMGEEYGETAPFHFFTSYGDDELAATVRAGRHAELAAHGPAAPDPQDPAAHEASRPDRSLAAAPGHRELLEWQRELLAMRRGEPALASLDPSRTVATAHPPTRSLVVVRRADPALAAPAVATICRFAARDGAAAIGLDALSGARWEVRATRGAPGLARGSEVDGTRHAPAPVRLDGFAAVVLVERRSARPDGA